MCRYSHPSNTKTGSGRCAFGANCTRPGCWYFHPVPEPIVQPVEILTPPEPITVPIELMEPSNNALFYINPAFAAAFLNGLNSSEDIEEDALDDHYYNLDEDVLLDEINLHYEMMTLLTETQEGNETLEDEITTP